MHTLIADLSKDLIVSLSVPDFRNPSERKPPCHSFIASVKEADGNRRIVINKDENDEVRVPLGEMTGLIELSIEFYYFDYTVEDDIHAVVSFNQDGASPVVDNAKTGPSEIRKRFIATICVFEINVVGEEAKV